MASAPQSPGDDDCPLAQTFYQIIQHYEHHQFTSNDPYNHCKLLRLTYEYAASQKSRNNLLEAFCKAIHLPTDNDIDLSIKETEKCTWEKLVEFADYLIDGFFLPLKATTKRTPQHSPAYHSDSATQTFHCEDQTFVDTTSRLKDLRGQCLQRDRHRCVISRAFDTHQAIERSKKFGDDFADDDGQALAGESFEVLEVAHILPQSLARTVSCHPLSQDDSQKAALEILNMLDDGIAHLIHGPEVDRPRNALTLTHSLHLLFGDYEVYFKHTGADPNTYQINSFLPPFLLNSVVPVTRTLFVTEARVIGSPSPRLLAIHRAIAHILHFSEAGRYIDTIVEDMEGQIVRVDGSTQLGRLVQLRMDKWIAE